MLRWAAGRPFRKSTESWDSPDLLFQDLTDWSVVEPNGFPDYRYNDKPFKGGRAVVGKGADQLPVAHGVIFVDKAPDRFGGEAVGNSVPREMHAAVMNWPMVQTGKPANSSLQVGISGILDFVETEHGLVKAAISLDGVARELYLQGANLISWQAPGERPVLQRFCPGQGNPRRHPDQPGSSGSGE
jgi:hypothetical protein